MQMAPPLTVGINAVVCEPFWKRAAISSNPQQPPVQPPKILSATSSNVQQPPQTSSAAPRDCSPKVYSWVCKTVRCNAEPHGALLLWLYTDLMTARSLFLLCFVASVLTTDPYQWLEEVGSLRSLEWVAERNASTVSAFQPDPRFAQFLHEAYTLAIHPERIPDTTLHGGEVYEFWRDNAHPRCVATARGLQLRVGRGSKIPPTLSLLTSWTNSTVYSCKFLYPPHCQATLRRGTIFLLLPPSICHPIDTYSEKQPFILCLLTILCF